jgi:Clostripain family
MTRRPNIALLAATLASIAMLSGCGQVGGAPAMVNGQAFDGFAALADLAGIDAQIDKARVELNQNGTLVKQLPSVKKAKPVTFLTYKALDNNLGVTLPQHINTLEKAGSNANINALAFTDDIGPKNTFRYYIRADKNDQEITSPYELANKAGDMNTGSGETLRRAIKWAFTEYPSRLRWLDVNNHGGGYYGIAQDDQKDDIIRLPELAKALKGAGQKLDVLSFDACLMATAEVAFELRDTAKVMVASEDSSYALGMNVDQTLKAMAAKPTVDADDLSRDLVLRAQRKGKVKALFTISAIDLSKAGNVTQAVDQLAGALTAAMKTEKPAILMSLKAVKAFYVAGPDKSDFNHRDLNEVVDQLRQRVTSPAVKAACQAVKTTLFNRGGAILLSRATNEEAGVARGLSIYLPLDGQVDPIYKDTAFAKATKWDEFLATLK